MSACTVPDCIAEKTVARGMCRNHYNVWWKRHPDVARRPTTGLSPQQRLIRLVEVGADNCWNWLGRLNLGGYGVFNLKDRPVIAHRASYRMFVGPISEGLHLDHLCRNRRCVNPAHLEAVTPAENNRRSSSPSALNAQKTTCPEGHPLDYVAPGSGFRACSRCNTRRSREGYHRSPRHRSRADMAHCITIPCPTCAAAVDEWCRRPGGVASFLHAARFNAAGGAA